MKKLLLIFTVLFYYTIYFFSQENVYSAVIVNFFPETVASQSTFIINLKHERDKTGKKLLRAFGYSSSYNLLISGTMLLLPENITKWEGGNNLNGMLSQYKNSFTQPPVFDHDLWAVNYIGHPYQGSFYYNSMRSQGANIATSALYNLSQILLWEYIWEGGMEQPSIQDLIVTPVVGSIIGELAYRATRSMGKNGFNWYEKAATIILNPSYLLNNGFKTAKRNATLNNL